MGSLYVCQEALADFDQHHWEHKLGAESVLHTYLHLTEALFRKFVYEAESLSQEEILKHWIVEIVPRLIEHTLRLANNCNFSLEERAQTLFARQNVSTIRHLSQSWYDLYREMVNSRQNDRWSAFKDYVRSLGEALHPLASICERLDHGETLDNTKCQKIASVATSLISHALLFLLLAEGIQDEEVIQERLVILFEQRLAKLSEYFEYAT